MIFRIFDRYFLKEFIPPFFFSVFALTFILLMDQLFRLIDLFVRKGLPFYVVVQILVYNLPLIISYTTPMALLIAMVMSFGRFGQDNEILALKTSGLSFLSIMKMPIIVVIITTLCLTFFNSYLLPESNHRARNLMLDVVRKRPAARLIEGVFVDEFPGYTVYIKKKDERRNKIVDVTIYDLRNNLIITAPEGFINNLDDGNIMQFVLYNGELHQLVDNTRYQKTKFDKQVINMHLDTEFTRRERKARSNDELNVEALLKNIKGTTIEIAQLKTEINNLARECVNYYLLNNIPKFQTGRFQIEQKNSILKGKLRNLSRYLIEFHKKFSLSFVCIVFLFLGAPLGYLFKRGGVGGILLGILLFSLYYILLLSGEELADRKNFPPFWAMWLPNFIILIPGILLFLIAENEHIRFKL